MQSREWLYSDPQHHPEPLVEAIRQAGWYVHVVQAHDRAHEILEKHRIHVGLAALDLLSGAPSDLFESRSLSRPVEQVRARGPEKFKGYRGASARGHAHPRLAGQRARTDRPRAPRLAPGVSLFQARSRAERAVIEACLQRNRHSITRAAQELKVTRPTLYRLLCKHGISV
jgi:hypothetical protein